MPITQGTLGIPKFVWGSGNVLEFTSTNTGDKAPEFSSRIDVSTFTDEKRMADGSLKVYVRNDKKIYNLVLQAIPQDLYDSLYIIWAAHTTIDFYKDKDEDCSEGTFYWSGGFNLSEHLYFGSGMQFYKGSINLIEV